VDQEPRPRPRLIEAGHDELAIAALPAVWPPVRAVVPSQRAVAQSSPHRVTNRRQVVDLRRERRVSPTTPALRDVAVVRRHVLDASRNLAPHELGLDPIYTRYSFVGPIIGGKLPESPPALRARPPFLPRLRTSVRRVVSTHSRRRRQLVVVDLGVVPALQSILDGQRRIARQRQSLCLEVIVDFAVARGVPPPVVPADGGLPAPLVVAR